MEEVFFALDQSEPLSDPDDVDDMDDLTFNTGSVSTDWSGEAQASLIEKEKDVFRRQMDQMSLAQDNSAPLPDFFNTPAPSNSSQGQQQGQQQSQLPLPSFFNSPAESPFSSIGSNQGNTSVNPFQQQTGQNPFTNSSPAPTNNPKPSGVEFSSPKFMVSQQSPKETRIERTENNIRVIPRKRTTPSTFTPKPSTRHIWTKPSKKMSAAEIDNILRIQEIQINSLHPYIEDYYFQNHLNKSSEKHQDPTYSHVPLYEAIGLSTFVQDGFQMEGVLGKIPSRSSKAPRPMLSLQDLNTESERNSSILLLMEKGFDRILDIEDIDKLINFSEASQESIATLNTKRTEIIRDLFQIVPLFILTQNSEQPQFREEAICAWEEDQPLLKFLNTHKGRKLTARMIPLLPGYYLHALYLFFMRNFCLVLSILEQSPDASSQILIPAIVHQIVNMDAQQILVGLQVMSQFHKDDQLIFITQTRDGLEVLQRMFHHVLMIFSHQSPQFATQQFVELRTQWFQSADLFFRRFINNFPAILKTNETDKKRHYYAVFMFLSTFSNFVSPTHHKIILAEIGNDIASISKEYQELLPVAHVLVSNLMRQ
uniref:mRNA decay factor PAT1 domain-containing protein n=1 Tax=Vannella robusta TaxID=1487602 RepID=A0A7S4I9J6_9EUKA|mmetsp:Transcript_2239/g.2739  ORF Transcript_2239/g.2739 Transcript_2239/m.2739 type:complete len:595 (+) Transcript_2239:66-1850(+)